MQMWMSVLHSEHCFLWGGVDPLRWTSCHVMGSVRPPASTTTTSTPTPASASAAGRRACSGAPCSSTAAATPPGSATPSRSPPTAPASGPEHGDVLTCAHTLASYSSYGQPLLTGRRYCSEAKRRMSAGRPCSPLTSGIYFGKESEM